MQHRPMHVYPLNRVEGDLKIQVQVEKGTVTDARCVGTLYRGFENLLIGRRPMDALVIAPRVCGICSTAHLKAAAKALDMVYRAGVPDNAIRIRNVTLMVELLQNDIRHAFLLFMPDFLNPAYRSQPLHEEAAGRYQFLKGASTLRAIRETKRILEIVAILGGQWPHSSFMVPGGVVSLPSRNELAQCRYLLRNYRRWYERQVLGCCIEEWVEVDGPDRLETWLDQNESHRESEVGFFLRFARAAGLHELGRGCGNFVCFGAMELPRSTRVATATSRGGMVFPAGFLSAGLSEPLDQKKITEDVTHAWFQGGGRAIHPYNEVTQPYATGSEDDKYTWAKAPRYNGQPAETGPLAEMLLGGVPLFTGMVAESGPSVLARELARLVRSAYIIPLLDTWLEETLSSPEVFYRDYEKLEHGRGFGLIEAARGALGHWVIIKDGTIEKYQIITPTAWNASPRCSGGRPGPCEQALIGTEIRDPDNPVEVDHIVRSFDPCLVCTVHAIDLRRAGPLPAPG